ncbi:MAG: SGNH/GDSL hydrolase family protein [Deltaproteobacteria bacterium]|nr:SGNH/GDSL hydrolase family protein [Myxococcales bacterium]MDP3220822.1 SGNH/GDSL hydrolase family protein [Deltaproteobacteria bacterium]
MAPLFKLPWSGSDPIGSAYIPQARLDGSAPLRPSFAPRIAACWVAALIAIAAIELTEAWLSWKNTLQHNGRWISSKVALRTGVVNAVAFVVTPRALTGSHLDMGAWLGFEEVLFRDAIALDHLSGRIRLANNAHITVLFGVDEKLGFSGVRFSRDPHFPSAVVTGEPDGRFTSRRPLGPLDLSDRWARFDLRFDGGRTRVSLDGREVADLPGGAPREGRFGFHSGRRSVLIDDVEATGRQRGLPARVQESFHNTAGYAPTLAIALGALGLLSVLGALLARKRGPWPTLVQLHITAGLMGASTLWILEPRLASVHPQQGPVLNAVATQAGFVSSIEFAPAVLDRIRAALPSPPGATRVVFLGSSQTAGIGTTHRAATFVSRLDATLRARRAPGAPPLTVINAAVVGDRSRSLVDRYVTEIELLRPHLLVVNLGNTDRDPVELGAQLERLAVFNAARAIQTVLVMQPTTLEGPPSNQPADDWEIRESNQRTMRGVAARYGLTIIDLHGALRPHHDDGFIWWDGVHLNNFGHALVADLLLPVIEREVLRFERGRRA